MTPPPERLKIQSNRGRRMKKQIFSILPLIVVGCLVGCTDNSPSSHQTGTGTNGLGGTSGTEYIDDNVYANLQNFKLDDKQNYVAIGAGSLADESYTVKNQTSFFKNAEKDEFGNAYVGIRDSSWSKDYYGECLESENRFYLIGQLKNDEIQKLSFSGEKDSLNICIDRFCRAGNFISFCPMMDTTTEREKYAVSTDQKAFFYDYILSTKSGKIYSCAYGWGTYFIKALNDGSLIAYVDQSGESQRLFHVYEDDNGLNFQNLGSNYEYFYVDKYNNIMIPTGIITSSDFKLHRNQTYFEEDAKFSYDPFLEVFYVIQNNDYYVFNENGEFVSTDFVGDYVVNKSYIKNNGTIVTYKNGEYQEEKRENEQINFNDKNTWDLCPLIQLAQQKIEADDDAEYYKNLYDDGFEETTKDIFLEAYKSYWGDERLKLLSDGCLFSTANVGLAGKDWVETGGYKVPYSTYYNRDSIFYTNNGVFEKTSEYGYLRKNANLKDIFNEGFSGNIIRNNAAYVLKNGNIYKYSFDDDSIQKLTFNDYDTKTMTVENKRIAITGTNDNFEEFKGYLDINDQISFKKINEESSFILNPIN